jgi:hypothetical protein
MSPTHVTLGIQLGRPYNSSAPAYAIVLALLVVVTVLPVAPAASGTLAMEALAKSLGVPTEALRPSAESPWKLVEETAGVSLQASAAGTYAITLRDVPLFGFHASAKQGTLTFLLDGAVVERFANENEPFDLAVPAGEHTLSWSFKPSSAGAVTDLVLDGVKPVRAPVVTAALLNLYGCIPPPATLTIVGAFQPTAVSARIDGVEVPATLQSALKGLGIVTIITIDVPMMPEGSTTHDLLVTVYDALGQGWDLAHQVLRTIVDLTTLTGPSGWAYQLRPDVFLVSTCLPKDVASIRLTVDGIERVVTQGVASLDWRFEQDLPFGEAHAWRFDLRLADGRAIAREGTFNEGLDVMEFDLSPGTIVAQSGAPSVFSSPENPDQLPLVAAFQTIQGFVQSSAEGFHARAVYAPLAITCSNLFGAKLCFPYGQHAEAALWAKDQTLTLSDSRGSWTYPGLGQIAAMSRESRIPLPSPEAPTLPSP